MTINSDTALAPKTPFQQTQKSHLNVSLIITSTVLAITAATATYLLVQLIQGGHLISIPGIGISPYHLTLYTTCTLYGFTAVLTVATVLILQRLYAHQQKQQEASSCCGGLKFLMRFIANPSKVGAIAPSSKGLAKQITSKIPDRSAIDPTEPAKRFLEIGPGTGVFTWKIIEKLGPQDHLDLVEYDSAFCAQLRKQFEKDPRVTIHEISITDFDAEPYDVVVSGLPLNAFKPEFVQQILKKYEKLTKSGGFVSYFEYIALEKIKMLFLFGKSYWEFCQVLNQKHDFVHKHHATHSKIWLNLPPARVQHCTINKFCVDNTQTT